MGSSSFQLLPTASDQPGSILGSRLPRMLPWSKRSSSGRGKYGKVQGEVDADWLTKPRQWTLGEIQRFILFIGPISSLFDYLTFFIMLYVFDCWNNPALFHTGWFVESLFTQTLIIHVVRTSKIPFIQSRARKLIFHSQAFFTATLIAQHFHAPAWEALAL